jgi:hypothetical protein
MHPETELFDYLNHSLAEEQLSAIETHLSSCEECASLAALIRALKAQQSRTDMQTQMESERNHPAINELASFFYSQEETADRVHLTSHIALCTSCAEAIAQYARGEKAAETYESSAMSTGVISAEAWKLIDDWENSSFGDLKPANEVLDQALLDRLSQLFNERINQETLENSSRTITADRVPVLVVSSLGEVRSIEFFEIETDHTGASVLRHSEGSARFDNKPIHVLFALDENEPRVVSAIMHRDTVRLEQARPEGDARRADYFIIED